jgi:UMF1 family MFS transporter
MKTDKKAIFGWVMFDFANSAYTTLIVTFIYSTYFVKAIARDEVMGTALWARGVTITAISVALCSPVLGALADQGNLRKSFLCFSTAVTVIGAAALYFIQPGQIMAALVWFVISNIAYELTMVFYNAFLPEIAPRDKIGRISGFGWGVGYIGGLAAMVIAMIGFIYPEVPWFGLSKQTGANIRATNLLVAVWFAVFAIPMFLFVRTKSVAGSAFRTATVKNGLADLRDTFREIRRYRQIIKFLIARLIYNDGLVTVFAFGGIYAAGTFGMGFKEIMVFGISLNVSAGIGALVMGFYDDKLGGKKTIQISNMVLAAATLLAVIAPGKALFWTAGILIGLFAGPNQSASRSLLGRFVPGEKENQFYGFFAFSGKLTAFIGPLLLGILTEVFNSQRAGVSIVVVFFVIGMLLLTGVDEKEGIAGGAGVNEVSKA